MNILKIDFPSSRLQPSEKLDEKRLRSNSCLLLEKATPRGGVKPRTSKRTNVHIVIEFGLQVNMKGNGSKRDKSSFFFSFSFFSLLL